MRLGLSSAAASDASLEDLLAACTARGLNALESWLRTLAGDGGDFAWEIDPAIARPPSEDLEEDVAVAVGQLTYIRLVGGGPEPGMQEGLGVGAFMGRLALAGYEGPLVVTRSSPRYRVAWATGLGRRGGWGCGSKASANDTVMLSPCGGVRSSVVATKGLVT